MVFSKLFDYRWSKYDVLKNFTNIVGNERVIGSSDCGFGTFAGFGTIDPDIAYEKLKVLAEGAAKV